MYSLCTHALCSRSAAGSEASLGDAKCAVFKEREKKTKQGAWFYRALHCGEGAWHVPAWGDNWLVRWRAQGA
jgi:hypothetical protein